MDYYNNQSSCFYPFLLNSVCLKHNQRDLLKTALRSWHLCTVHPPVSFHFTQVKSRFFQDLGHYLDPAHLSQLISHHAPLHSHCSSQLVSLHVPNLLLFLWLFNQSYGLSLPVIGLDITSVFPSQTTLHKRTNAPLLWPPYPSPFLSIAFIAFWNVYWHITCLIL